MPDTNLGNEIMKKLLTQMGLFDAWIDMLDQGMTGNIVGKTLQYTWEVQVRGGKIVSTLTEDGTVYSQ